MEESYARWRVQPRVAPDPGTAPSTGPSNGSESGAPTVNGSAGQFQPYLLPFTYQQFGDFAGEC